MSFILYILSVENCYKNVWLKTFKKKWVSHFKVDLFDGTQEFNFWRNITIPWVYLQHHIQIIKAFRAKGDPILTYLKITYIKMQSHQILKCYNFIRPDFSSLLPTLPKIWKLMFKEIFYFYFPFIYLFILSFTHLF